MTEQMARDILVYGLAFGVLFWSIAIWMRGRMLSLPDLEVKEYTIPGSDPEGVIRGVIRFFSQHAKVLESGKDMVTVDTRSSLVRIKANRQGADTLLHLEVDFSGKRGMHLVMTLLVFLIQPVVIFGLFLLLWNLVPASDSVNVRWQSVQILHMIHVLWPPFLVFFLRKKIRRITVEFFDNLPHYLKGQEGVKG